MNLSQNALTVLERRYLKKDEFGNVIETPEDMFHRVAEAIAKAEYEYNGNDDTVRVYTSLFYDMMTNMDFLPNSPTLMNAGRHLGQLSACFVLPVEDSMDEIFDSVKNAALIHKSGGGTGFSFSRIRPDGSCVKSTGGVASGPISFMKVFNAATDVVKQGGTRRGANMGILRVDHPDIINFIKCKSNPSELTNFNISVGITDVFMKAVKQDGEYDLIEPKTGKVVHTLKAKEVFDLIVEMAWKNGEPGILFLDRINDSNPVKSQGEIEATNPCGEQPLLPYESCNLGSINLNNMLLYQGNGYRLDIIKLHRTVKNAVRFLDNVITVNQYPLEHIKEMTLKTRKIGLGVMGFADMLFKLGIPYNSELAVELAKNIMFDIHKYAYEASQELATQRGAFPLFNDSVYAGEREIRNATQTTIAPTGTISIIANVSSGVEPLFALSFIRNVMDNDELPQVDSYFKSVADSRGFYSDELMVQIAKEGTIANIQGIPEDVKKVFVTAHDISPEYHIKIQSAFQMHTDNAVSKTVNFGHNTTKEDIKEAYLLSYDLGCKGVTIYRDGSRDSQVLNIGKVNEKETEVAKIEVPVEVAKPAVNAVKPRPRPTITTGTTEKVVIGCGNLYITINHDENGICEAFTSLGKAGGCPSQSEAVARMISLAVRTGVPVDAIVEQLKGIRCHSTLRQKSCNSNINVLSCPDAIGKVLEKVSKQLSEKQVVPVNSTNEVKHEPNKSITTICPECGNTISHEAGCVMCRHCGYSRCG